ncbi:hypothetical protein T440DRAFT_467046 [Plenodomus tracheiphilus IPT5]|uniref:F-box domain-containing protein n=1 Tax=Plenodomus tracheiphilus IPT5 TaxID=1408161 RepID=A0A6A7BA02_9PLEO|nr:hypothetical protein T440DRAFT_467046 [Plenodomus tracheiphilus IPT5]
MSSSSPVQVDLSATATRPTHEPYKMRSSASFYGLPVEVVQKICQYLPEQRDVFYLRRVSRLHHAATTSTLAPRLANKLSKLRVLTTEEGLETLLQITSFPEWKDHIRRVELVDPGVEALLYSKQDHDEDFTYRWFGYFKLEGAPLDAIKTRIGPAQHKFWMERAADILAQIFTNLRSAKSLEDIHIGVKTTMPLHVVGLEHLMQDIGFTRVWKVICKTKINKYLPVNDTAAQYLLAGPQVLREALTSSGIRKQIVCVQLRNLRETGITWSIPQIWPAFDHPAIKALTISDLAHGVAERTDVKTSTRCFEELRLAGCKGSAGCKIDTDTFALLGMTHLPQLVRLDIRNYAIDERAMLTALRSVRETIRSVTLAHIHLTSGKWSAIFIYVLMEFPQLDECNFSWLIEGRDICTRTGEHLCDLPFDEPEREGKSHRQVRVKGDRAREYLMTMHDDYRHLPSNERRDLAVVEHRSVGFPVAEGVDQERWRFVVARR